MRGGVDRDDQYAFALPEDAKLFQGFDRLQLRGRPVDIAAQESGGVGVNADMPQPGIFGGGLAIGLAETVPMPGDGGAAEVEGVAMAIEHDLDRMRIEDIRGIDDGGGQSGDLGGFLAGQGIGQLANQIRLHEGFIALQVDHEGVIRPIQRVRHLGDALGPAAVVLASHDGGHGEIGHRPGDAGIIGRNVNLAARLQRPFADMDNHRLAGDVQQRLAG